MSLVCVFLVGCDHGDRIKNLEKETAELNDESKRAATAIDFDVSSKCAEKAKTWVNENYLGDRDTITLHHMNHYSKTKKGCFVFVEWHYSLSKKTGSWANNMSLWDAVENAQVADFSQNHTVLTWKNYELEDGPIHCETSPKPCHTLNDFNNFIAQYLND